MQSQKSLANATKSIVKLMQLHDHASHWSLLDQDRGSASRGSANFIATRVTTADPKNFGASKTSDQFRIKRARGSTAKTAVTYDGKSYLTESKKESKALNEQRQKQYNASLNTVSGKNMDGVLRSACGIEKLNAPQAMYTNLNEVIRLNP